MGKNRDTANTANYHEYVWLKTGRQQALQIILAIYG